MRGYCNSCTSRPDVKHGYKIFLGVVRGMRRTCRMRVFGLPTLSMVSLSSLPRDACSWSPSGISGNSSSCASWPDTEIQRPFPWASSCFFMFWRSLAESCLSTYLHSETFQLPGTMIPPLLPPGLSPRDITTLNFYTDPWEPQTYAPPKTSTRIRDLNPGDNLLTTRLLWKSQDLKVCREEVRVFKN